MKPSLEEQETVIQFDRTGSVAHIDTTDTTMMTKLDKLVAKSDKWIVVKNHYSQEHELIGREYMTDKKLISYRGDTAKRTMTEEQKQAAADRIRKIRENQNS